jgi:hypothetical protein
LRVSRTVNGYRRISLFNHTIEVPKVELYEEVEIHLVPDAAQQVMEARIWWHSKMVHSVTLPLDGFRVHLLTLNAPPTVHFSTFPNSRWCAVIRGTFPLAVDTRWTGRTREVSGWRALSPPPNLPPAAGTASDRQVLPGRVGLATEPFGGSRPMNPPGWQPVARPGATARCWSR